MKCPTCDGSGEVSPPDTFGGRVSYTRQQMVLSLDEVAKNSGLTKFVWQRAEAVPNAACSLDNANKVAKFLGVTVDWLLNGDEDS